MFDQMVKTILETEFEQPRRETRRRINEEMELAIVRLAKEGYGIYDVSGVLSEQYEVVERVFRKNGFKRKGGKRE